MKKNNNLNSFKSFFANFKLYTDVYKAGSMIKLSNEKHLKLVLKEVGWRIVTLSFLSTKETSRFRMLHNFAAHLIKMNKNHGEVYTTKYLKASQLAIQKKLAGQPLKSLREVEPDFNFPRLSKSGLPSIIKTTDRSSICNCSYSVIRFYLSLFSLYRVIKLPCQPKIQTITDNFGGNLQGLSTFNLWLGIHTNHFVKKFLNTSLKDLKCSRILPIIKSSPQGPLSYRHLFSSYFTLKYVNTSVFDSMKKWISLTKSSNMTILFSNIEFLFKTFLSDGKHLSHSPIGRLSFKEEAAGKLRIFAMVDIITQSLLRPLHDQLFSLFKKIPNDCTHDQDKGFKMACDLSIKHNCSFGFDLTAATDRLPIVTQVAVLNSLYGNGIGDLWSNILINRDYLIETDDYDLPDSVRYTVGQPMGALSSWAMLNLVHHLMIQYIAFELGKTKVGDWYLEYVVLGDDLVLFEKDVADRYLILCKDLGVSINLSKSIIAESKPVVEFAKRTAVNGVDVSALPFKELLSCNNFFGRLSLTSKLVHRGWGKNLFKILSIGNRTKVNRTIDIIYPLVGFLTQSYQLGKISLSHVLGLTTSSDHPLSFFGRNINWMKPGLITKVVSTYLSTSKFDTSMIPRKEVFHSAVNSMTFKNVLLFKIQNIVKHIESLNISDIRRDILFELEGLPFFDKHCLNNLGIEISEEDMKSNTRLTLRDKSYYKDPKFKVVLDRLSYFECLCDIFLARPNLSVPNISHLVKGLDIDLNLSRGFNRLTSVYRFKYLNSWESDSKAFYAGKAFADLEVESLVKDLTILQGLVKELEFYKLKSKDKNKEVIDNPLKVLDFIKDINNPNFKVKSDFVKFEGQYLDSSIVIEKPRGFKPKFDFAFKTKKLISLVF